MGPAGRRFSLTLKPTMYCAKGSGKEKGPEFTLSVHRWEGSRNGGPLTAHWVSVSTFIFTTPALTAVVISCFVDPEPPWKTRKTGLSRSDLSCSLT